MTTSNEPPDGALPIRPMSRRPIGFPRSTPSSLSDDARVMHRVESGRRLKRDPFDRKSRHRFVTREEEKAFRPTERMLAAIAELEAVDLASYRNDVFYSTRTHERYSYAVGRGAYLIRVSVFEEHPDYDAKLLAVLIGADLESRDTRNDGMPEIVLRARHEDATDFEHDASSTAMLTVRNPTMPKFSGYGRMTFTGVLTEASIYPIGVDPLQAEDQDTHAGELCTSEHCKPHPFAPYMPPKIELPGPQFVTIEAYPIRPYLVEDPGQPPLSDSEDDD